MATLLRPVAFLTASLPQSFAFPSTSITASPRLGYTTRALPFPRRLATIMRYALTALLIFFVILSATPASVHAWLPLFRKSGAVSTPSTEYVTALSTVPNENVAQTISETLVSSKLVACVNTIPGIKSTYWWEGKVQRDTEFLLMMKTTASLVPQVIEHITKLHPYDVPEVIVQPITAGHMPYLQWIGESTRKGDSAV